MAPVEPGVIAGSDALSAASSGGGGLSSAGTALGFDTVSGGLDILGGLYGLFAGETDSEIAASRARVFRMEAEADAERYALQAERFKSEQAVRFLKSGVTLSGSPLTILDETIRVSAENISAMRMRSEQEALNIERKGLAAKSKGRAALLSGVTKGSFKIAKGIFDFQGTADLGQQNRLNTNPRSPSG